MPKLVEKYGRHFPANASDLAIEMGMIRKLSCGDEADKLRLPFHYERMRQILWPHLDTHRWHELCRDEILKNKITVLMGPGSCGKTHEAAWIYLCEYFVFPEETCVLVSSTDVRGLRLRVWGEITMLWNAAKETYPELPGHLVDSKIAICTDLVDPANPEKARDMRKGIIGIPCMQNNKFVGLGKYCGIKQKRVRLIADEAQFMGSSFLSAFANLDKNVDFRAVVLGNPSETLDPLGRAAEPKDGWTTHMEPSKTTIWDTKFMNGRCVNLIGTDSPNFDFPEKEPTRFPYLISREKIKNTLSFFPKDSLEYYQQCVGAMKIGVLARRVISRDLCRLFHAFDEVIWKGTPVTRIYALDAAYGGDRCVGGYVEFGEDVSGKIVLSIHPPYIIPIRPGDDKIAEDQIAERVASDCIILGIPPENMFYDATGRGSLGTALAREWSAKTNPVEFGGAASQRPVSLDLYILDPKTRERRLKTCYEHYSKFVTELWFSVRYAIEAGQIRNLPEEVMEEGCMREWKTVKNDRKELETKEKMKERVGRSPDMFDWLSIAVEGARRRGFQIAKLASVENESTDLAWLEEMHTQNRRVADRYSLDFAA